MNHLLPFISGLLFWVSFPPVNFWPLMWVAPVPLLVYILAKPLTWRRAAVLYAAGYLNWAANVYWFWYVAPPGIFLGPLYRGLYWPVLAVLIQRARGPISLRVPVLWSLFEYLSLHFPLLGFPFCLIGYSQVEMDNLIQIADVGGVFLVGFLIIICATILAKAFIEPVDAKAHLKGVVIGSAVLLLAFGYGLFRTGTMEVRQGASILVVQPNIPQDIKEIARRQRTPESASQAQQRVMDIYRTHMEITREGLLRTPPDLVIWPEAAVPWLVRSSDLKVGWPSRVAAELGVSLCTGCEILEGREVHNSCLLVDPQGDVLGRYDKVELVAFGEYVPKVFRWFVDYFSELKFENASPGSEFKVWMIAGMTIGPEICFEGLLPWVTRDLARKGACAIVNISNDGWFRGSGELDQVLAIARFRAVESRVGFVRATNTGISAIIDPAGRISQQIYGKERWAYMAGRILYSNQSSVYRSIGDVFVGVCALVGVLLLLPKTKFL